MSTYFSAIRNWIHQKTMPRALASSQWTGTSALDSFRKVRQPTPNELIQELKATAWTCASLNAQTCATYQPKLYVTTNSRQPAAKCPRKPIPGAALKTLTLRRDIAPRIANTDEIEQVTDHPILDLFKNVNPIHNAFDLWELTTLYQEVHGSAYWYLSIGPFGVPDEIWVLPTQNMIPKRDPQSPNIVDRYEYRIADAHQDFTPDQIIHFRYPDPRDPYLAGRSPLQACYEQVSLTSTYAAFKAAKFDNRAIPDAILSPEETIGEEERARLEIDWNQRLRKGGAGRVIVAEQKMKLDLLEHSMADAAELAEMSITKELIMNAFHVPVAYFTSSTNLANLQASQLQHATQCIQPRLARRDEKINEQLIPLFDPSGRLFVASEEAAAPDAIQIQAKRAQDLFAGVRTINEVRREDGLPPVPWGQLPWMQSGQRQTDQLRLASVSPGEGAYDVELAKRPNEPPNPNGDKNGKP